MFDKVQRAYFVAFCLCVIFVGVVSFSFGQLDVSLVSLSGSGWSLKVNAVKTSGLVSVYAEEKVDKTSKELFATIVDLKTAEGLISGVEFYVSVNGLQIFKQLPLDQELNVKEYDFVNATVAMRKDFVVVSRPQNVVNSFACFDGYGRKVLHIYASKLVDAKGLECWVDQDLKNGVLTVYLNQTWLAKAVFPVVLDPEFGYTSVGGSSGAFGPFKFASKFQMGSLDGEALNITWYCANKAADTNAAKLCIYNDNAGSPDSLVANVTVSVSGSGWIVGSLNNESLVANNYYWLSANVNSDSGWSTLYAYDTGDANQGCYHNTNYANEPLDPFGDLEELSTKKLSIYVGYVVGTSPTPTPTVAPSATISEEQNNFSMWILLVLVASFCFPLIMWKRKQ